ncbi:helix-turn-helix domain-containing protein [Micromonospora tulbaghiae]|uniref:TetR/AcrR family transcriptional regulator n=1 Tax=Micromonospora tulbaghiae TaxID=479978 RepID=UPI0033FBF494
MAERVARTRSDAARNQRLLMDAAARTFAVAGLDVPVSQIVDAAGLGKGTAFRCFATKGDLVAAIVRERLDALAAQARGLVTGDPGAVVFEFVRLWSGALAEDRGLREAMDGPAPGSAGVWEGYRALVDAVEALVGRARAAGAVRADVSAADLLLLVAAAVHAAVPLSGVDPAFRDRFVGLVCDGLRSGPPGTPARPAPTREELAKVWTGSERSR